MKRARRILLILCLLAPQAQAIPELFEATCASCHADDTPTCAGCHNHQLYPIATPNQASYVPGEAVIVELGGAQEPGWIRAILYDDSDNVLYRHTGPTEAGDDGTGPPIDGAEPTPVLLQSVAPMMPGTYTWQAAYYGVFSPQSADHRERRVPVDIVVRDPNAPPDVIQRAWSSLKALFR